MQLRPRQLSSNSRPHVDFKAEATDKASAKPNSSPVKNEAAECSSQYGKFEGLCPESALAFASEAELAHCETAHKELQDLKDNETGIPHRWYVVMAMVAAFALCNMDKVHSQLQTAPDVATCCEAHVP